MSEKSTQANIAPLFSQGTSIIISVKDAGISSPLMSSSPRIIPNAEVLYVADANRCSSKSTTTLTGIVGEKIRTPRDDPSKKAINKLDDQFHSSPDEVQQINAVLPKVNIIPAVDTQEEKTKGLSIEAIIEETDSKIMNDSIISIPSVSKEEKTPPINTTKPRSTLMNGNAVLRKGSLLLMSKGSKSQLDIPKSSSPDASPRQELESPSGVLKIAMNSCTEQHRPSSATKNMRSGSLSERNSYAGWGGTAMHDFVDHLLPGHSDSAHAAQPFSSNNRTYGGGYRTHSNGKLPSNQTITSNSSSSSYAVNIDSKTVVDAEQDGHAPAISPRLKSATAYRHAYALLYMNKANKNARVTSKIDNFLSVAKDLQLKSLEREEVAFMEERQDSPVEEDVPQGPPEGAEDVQEEVITTPQRYIRKRMPPSFLVSPPPPQRDTTAVSSPRDIAISKDMIISIQKQIRNYTQIRDLHSPSGLERLIQVKEQERIDIRSTNCRSVNDFIKTKSEHAQRQPEAVSPPISAMARKSFARGELEKREKKKLAFDDDIAVCVAPLPSIPPPEVSSKLVIEEGLSDSAPGNRSITVKFPVTKSLGESHPSPSTPSSPISMFRRKSWYTHGKRGSTCTRLSVDSSILDLASMQSEPHKPDGSEQRSTTVEKDPSLQEEFETVLQDKPLDSEAHPHTTTTTTTTTTIKSQHSSGIKPFMSVHISKKPLNGGADIQVSSHKYTKRTTGAGNSSSFQNDDGDDNNNHQNKNSSSKNRYKLMQYKHTGTSNNNNDAQSKYLLSPDTPAAPANSHPDRGSSPSVQDRKNESLHKLISGYSLIGSSIIPANTSRPTTAETRIFSQGAAGLPSSQLNNDNNNNSRPNSAPMHSNRWRGHKL